MSLWLKATQFGFTFGPRKPFDPTEHPRVPVGPHGGQFTLKPESPPERPDPRPRQAKQPDDPNVWGWELMEPDFVALNRERAGGHYGVDWYNRVVRQYRREKSDPRRAAIKLDLVHRREILNRARQALRDEKGIDRRSTPEGDAAIRQILHDEYIRLVKDAISVGKPVPYEVIEQHPEFRAALTGRQRYEKGRHTSFANVSVAVDATMQAERGFKIKRQDGRPMTHAVRQDVLRGVGEVEEVLGSLAGIMRDNDLTIAHTVGKQPFMQARAAGLYSPLEKTVTTGMSLNPSLAHELGHWIDYEAGEKLGKKTHVSNPSATNFFDTSSLAEAERGPLIREARDLMNDTRSVQVMLHEDSSKIKDPTHKRRVQITKVVLGPYWNQPREIIARLTEQYVAYRRGQEGWSHNKVDWYEQAPGWWTREDFEHLIPQFEAELVKRLEAVGGEKAAAPFKAKIAAWGPLKPTAPPREFTLEGKTYRVRRGRFTMTRGKWAVTDEADKIVSDWHDTPEGAEKSFRHKMFQAFTARLKAEQAAEIARVTPHVEEFKRTGVPVEFERKGDRPGVAVLSRDASEPGKYRMTMFDERGPTYHTVYDTPEQAAAEHARDLTGKVVPGTIDRWSATPQWAEGMAHIARVREANEEIQRRLKEPYFDIEPRGDGHSISIKDPSGQTISTAWIRGSQETARAEAEDLLERHKRGDTGPRPGEMSGGRFRKAMLMLRGLFLKSVQSSFEFEQQHPRVPIGVPGYSGRFVSKPQPPPLPTRPETPALEAVANRSLSREQLAAAGLSAMGKKADLHRYGYQVVVWGNLKTGRTVYEYVPREPGLRRMTAEDRATQQAIHDAIGFPSDVLMVQGELPGGGPPPPPAPSEPPAPPGGPDEPPDGPPPKPGEIRESFMVPEERLAQLQERIEKLSKRALKLGLPPIVLTVGEPRFEKLSRGVKEEGIPLRVELAMYKVYPVTVTGERPIIAGWEFRATLEHGEDEEGGAINIVRTLPGVDDLPEEYRTVGQKCDHCKLERRRNDTYIVRNVETGEYKQVGRNCLKDFTGHADPEALAAAAQFLADLRDVMGSADDWEGGAGDGPSYIDQEYFLAVTAALIRTRGWASRQMAMNDATNRTTATADSTWNMTVPGRSQDARERSAAWLKENLTDTDRETAREAIAWVEAGFGHPERALSDYEWNVAAALRSGVVGWKHTGLAASAVASYLRWKGQEILRKHAAATSKHFGDVGKRSEYVLSLEGVQTIEGMYGTTYLHRFVDQHGNQAVWFGSSPLAGLLRRKGGEELDRERQKLFDEFVARYPEAHDPSLGVQSWKLPPEARKEFDERWIAVSRAHDEAHPATEPTGKTFHVKATVKEHREFRGVKQTVLTRVDPVAEVPEDFVIPEKKKRGGKLVVKAVTSFRRFFLKATQFAFEFERLHPRVPAGLPHGGEFAPKPNAEPPKYVTTPRETAIGIAGLGKIAQLERDKGFRFVHLDDPDALSRQLVETDLWPVGRKLFEGGVWVAAMPEKIREYVAKKRAWFDKVVAWTERPLEERVIKVGWPPAEPWHVNIGTTSEPEWLARRYGTKAAAIADLDTISKFQLESAANDARERAAWIGETVDFPDPEKMFVSAVASREMRDRREEIEKKIHLEEAARKARHENAWMRRVASLPELATKLRRAADALDPLIEQKMNPAIGQQNVTMRRARIASGMMEEGRHLQKVQRALHALADHAEKGTLPEVAQGLNSRAAVEQLLWGRGEYPQARIHSAHFPALMQFATPEDRATLQAALEWGDPNKAMKVVTPSEIEAAERGAKAANEKADKRWNRVDWDHVGHDVKDWKRAQKIGLNNPEKWNAARDFVRGLAGEHEPTKEEKIREMERGLLGKTFAGYFPTPKIAAEAAAEKARIEPGMTVLEPSAGKGDMADAILRVQPEAKIKGVELVHDLAKVAQARGHDVEMGDFFAHEGTYDRIVMNPPFEAGAEMDHVQRAYEHNLKPGGRLVSIMSQGPFFRNDRKAVEFRAWLERVGGEAEDMPEGSFKHHESSDRIAGVRTRMVVIDKPKDAPAVLKSLLSRKAQLEKALFYLDDEDLPALEGRDDNESVLLKSRLVTHRNTLLGELVAIDSMLKARKVRRPGSRGGQFYYDDKGEVVYGVRPQSRTKGRGDRVTLDDLREIVEKTHAKWAGMKWAGDAFQATRLEILLHPHVYKVWQRLNPGWHVERLTDPKWGPGYEVYQEFKWGDRPPSRSYWNKGGREDWHGANPGTAWDGVRRNTRSQFIDDLYMMTGENVAPSWRNEALDRAHRQGLRLVLSTEVPKGFAIGDRFLRQSGNVVHVVGAEEGNLVVDGPEGRQIISPTAITSGRIMRVPAGFPDELTSQQQLDIWEGRAPSGAITKSRALHGRRWIDGLHASIENRRGSVRHWTNEETGEQGRTKLKHPYGYFRGTMSTDGDHHDVFLGPLARSGDVEETDVYAITTMKAPEFTEIDEQKHMIGFPDLEAARAAFLAHYDDPRFLGQIDVIPWAEYKREVRATAHGGGLVRGHVAERAPLAKGRVLLFSKAHIKEYQRRSATGQTVTVREHEDKRQAAQQAAAGGARGGGAAVPKFTMRPPTPGRTVAPAGPLKLATSPASAAAAMAQPLATEKPPAAGEAVDHAELGRYIESFRPVLVKTITRLSSLFPDVPVGGRLKETASLAEKLVRKAKGLGDIEDIGGSRVELENCADILSAVERIKRSFKVRSEDDYISNPKGGVYRSYHLIVEQEGGRPIEVQVRTPRQTAIADAMHDITYKTHGGLPPAEAMPYFKQVADYFGCKDGAPGATKADCGQMPDCPPPVAQVHGCVKEPQATMMKASMDVGDDGEASLEEFLGIRDHESGRTIALRPLGKQHDRATVFAESRKKFPPPRFEVLIGVARDLKTFVRLYPRFADGLENPQATGEEKEKNNA